MKKIRFGVLSTGSIASKFVNALVNHCTDVVEFVAIATRNNEIEKAKEFIARNCPNYNVAVTPYGNYEDLVKDENVDAVYIGSPHTFHKDNVILCLNAGKHVLCEKPFTLTAKEAQEVIDVARAKNLFVMEAMWTRFFPGIVKVKELVESGEIGEVMSIMCDFGFFGPFENKEHRLYNMALGGGALLDVGIYPLALTSFLLNRQKPASIQSSMIKERTTNVDETTSILLKFEKKKEGEVEALASLQCSVRVKGTLSCLIGGTKGYIKINTPFYKPFSVQVCRTVQRENKWYDEKIEELDFKYEGNGMQFEIRHVAECLQAGKKESPVMPLDETLELMSLMDKIRHDNNFKYPGEE